MLRCAAVRTVDVSGRDTHALLCSWHTGCCAPGITDDGAGQAIGRSRSTEQGPERGSGRLLYRADGHGLHAIVFDLG